MRTPDLVLVWLTVDGNANVIPHRLQIHVKGLLPVGPVREPIDSRSSSTVRGEHRQQKRPVGRQHVKPTVYRVQGHMINVYT